MPVLPVHIADISLMEKHPTSKMPQNQTVEDAAGVLLHALIGPDFSNDQLQVAIEHLIAFGQARCQDADWIAQSTRADRERLQQIAKEVDAAGLQVGIELTPDVHSELVRDLFMEPASEDKANAKQLRKTLREILHTRPVSEASSPVYG